MDFRFLDAYPLPFFLQVFILKVVAGEIGRLKGEEKEIDWFRRRFGERHVGDFILTK
jgi:hypothetical protein